MNSITRNVRDIDSKGRLALEHVLGQPLKENERVTIQVETLPSPDNTVNKEPQNLPEWCNVYEGLTEEEIAEVERIALSRANMTRPSE